MTNIVLIDVEDLRSLIKAETQVILDQLHELRKPPEPDWVTLKDAARFFNVTPRTIHNRIENGTLEARGDGRIRMVKVR